MSVQGNSYKRSTSDSPLRKNKRLKPSPAEDVFPEDQIMAAIQRSTEEDLIGDFSRPYSLPVTQGRHQDLKSITASTLANLIEGKNQSVASFRIIDCRFPYEFDGGHIDGALNIFKKEQCSKLFELKENVQILVFHCEFSMERGPNLYRYLRQEDREKNGAAYPALYYPEMYLLEGGYKNFFGEFAGLCRPKGYTEMLHPEYRKELLRYRSSKRNRKKKFC